MLLLLSFRSGAYHNLVCVLERSSQRVPGRHLKREGRSQRTELNEEIIAKVPAEPGVIEGGYFGGSAIKI